MVWPKEKLGTVVEILDSMRKPVKAGDRIEGPYPYYGANGQQGTINDFIFDGIQINDNITMNIYGRDITGIVKNFRNVDYADFTINFVMVLNTNYAQSIPHEYIGTVKLSNQHNFQEYVLLQQFPNISSIKISNYAEKINQLFCCILLSIFF